MQLNKCNADFVTKMHEIYQTIYNNKSDISIITEANTGKEDPGQKLEISKLFDKFSIETNTVYTDKVSRIAVIIADTIDYTRRTDLENKQTPCIVIQVHISKQKSIFVVGFYRQWKLLDQTNPYPSRSPCDQMFRFSLFRNIIDKIALEDKPTVILGDLNLDRFKDNDPYTRTDIKDTLPMLDSLLDDHSFTQHNWQPTRFRAGQRPTCLDLVISNCPTKIAEVNPVINNTSEHEGIKCKFSDSDYICPVQFGSSRRYNNMTKQNILSTIDHDHYNSIFSISDPDVIAEAIIEVFTNVIDTLAPLKKFQIRKKSIFQSQKTLDLRDEVSYLFKIFKRSNSQDDQRALKNARNRLSRSMKSDQKQHEVSQLNDNFWREFKTYKNSETSIPTRIKVGQELKSSPRELSNTFNQFFTEKVRNLRANIKHTNTDAIEILAAVIEKPKTTFDLQPVSSQQVFEILMSLKTSKNHGVDCITTLFLKRIPRISSALICHLYSNILRTGKFPDILKESRILPIKKAGKSSIELKSYRPINNLSAIDKVLEEIIRVQVDNYFESNDLISSNHHGGRKHHSTLSAHLAIQSANNFHMDKRKTSCVMATDLSAAFDLVDTHIFTSKMRFYGVQKKTTDIFESYMSNRKSRVTLQGYTSEEVICEPCGSVQGGKLSGLIFNISINEATEISKIMSIPRLYRKITKKDLFNRNVDHVTVNFVDDQNNMVAADSHADIEAYLREFMLLLLHFYGANRLKINDEKTQILVLKGQFKRTISLIASDNTIIWNTAQIKILGVYTNAKNNYTNNIARARSKAFLRLSQLKPLLENNISMQQRRMIVSSSALSILRYCSPLYSGQSEQTKSKFHTAVMRCYRMIYSKPTYLTRCEKICKEISLPMPREIIAKDSAIFFHRLIIEKRPVQLYSLLRFPTRNTRSSAPELLHRPMTERSRRDSINVMLKLYSSIDQSTRGLSVKSFKSIIRHYTYNILIPDDQRN